jgi:hypothetical protein
MEVFQVVEDNDGIHVGLSTQRVKAVNGGKGGDWTMDSDTKVTLNEAERKEWSKNEAAHQGDIDGLIKKAK